jgi:hypothetical protein
MSKEPPPPGYRAVESEEVRGVRPAVEAPLERLGWLAIEPAELMADEE